MQNQSDQQESEVTELNPEEILLVDGGIIDGGCIPPFPFPGPYHGPISY